jgi:tyrosyl-tRNA synthetase
MLFKKGLAQRIITDFHGEPAAKQALDDWEKQFQRDEVPEDVETTLLGLVRDAGKFDLVVLEYGSVRPDLDKEDFVGPAIPFVRTDKMLMLAGLADSATDAQRKLKQNAVRINGEIQSAHTVIVSQLPMEFVVRVGRKMKRIVIAGNAPSLRKGPVQVS